jgi:hypothetical protein
MFRPGYRPERGDTALETRATNASVAGLSHIKAPYNGALRVCGT